MPRIVKPSPDPYRTLFAPTYRWNRQIRVTDDHRLFRFLPTFAGWTKEQHEARARRWRMIGVRLETLWSELATQALATYGDNGPLISGVIRDHFPPAVKDRLRRAARGSSAAKDRSLAHWRAAGRRIETWRTI